MADKIGLLARNLPVAELHWALLSHPELWNQHSERVKDPASPHYGLDDIWCRFVPPNPVEVEGRGYLSGDAIWYPSADLLGVRAVAHDMMRLIEGTELGGVLITRIPPGARCRPHADDGWHAERYQKIGVQIASAPGQEFCFDDQTLETRPGDVFWFNNHFTHWVTNPTPYERITLIVCIRKEF